ncbi:MAG: response regulator [Bacteroidota bacterium]
MKTILVEDNIAEARLTQFAYSAVAPTTELVHCNSGTSFFETLEKTPPETIAYILLDLNMPAISGFDVLKMLAAHKEWSWLPTIVLTSSSNQKDILASYELGANAYVTKPILMDDLNKIIAHIHKFWGEENRLPGYAGF